ncbi:MAG TPA: hypothetical protein DEP23_05185 [Ruminococcaceae bacterium]|nr:hypothetical protein [Oscillospiraceae bacterium]
MIQYKWEAIVLDLDGTLADTLHDIAESTNAALIKNGYPPYDINRYRVMVGNGLQRLIERAANGADEATVGRIMADFVAIYDRDCLKSTKVYDGMPEVLAILRKAGVKLFVVTNKPDAQAQKIVTGLYGDGLFQGVYGNREGRATKPDPALTIQILSNAGVSPLASLFVGDSDVDIFTAANAGMKSAGVVWGFRTEQELISAGADYIFSKPQDILIV